MLYSFVRDDVMTMATCDVMSRDVVVGGRGGRTCCCAPGAARRRCSAELTVSATGAGADSAPLYEFTYSAAAQRAPADASSIGRRDKRLTPGPPRCSLADRATGLPPPLLPPPPPITTRLT